uniref:Transmembrane protein n=1 Tax=Panagrellus redivivus TaxID=6233 RepID=A0A7E4W6M8_PANRE
MNLVLSPGELFVTAACCLSTTILVVYPPAEARKAGFVIPTLFYSFVGDEKFNFIQHHLKRSCLTMFVHAALPMVYTLAIYFYFFEQFHHAQSFDLVHVMFRTSLLVLLGAVAYIFKIARANFQDHSILANLSKYMDVEVTLQNLITEVNEECRNFHNFKVEYVGYSKVVITENWIIKASMYTIQFLKISDARLTLIRAIDPPVLASDVSGLQLIDVLAESVESRIKPITIRVYSRAMFAELKNHLGRNIEIKADIQLKASLNERFVDVFNTQIQQNPRYAYDYRYDIEPCMGCQFVDANVKIDKNCLDTNLPYCKPCQCKPMWCTTCIARIFASKQIEDEPERWMTGTAECPTCRATFCAFDVCLLADDERSNTPTN